MFDELTKYKHNDHFFFEATQKIREVCNAPTDKSGLYTIYKLAKGKIELIYIGSSGQNNKNGTIKENADKIFTASQINEIFVEHRKARRETIC